MQSLMNRIGSSYKGDIYTTKKKLEKKYKMQKKGYYYQSVVKQSIENSVSESERQQIELN